LGFRIESLRFRAWGEGSGVKGSEPGFRGLGFRVYGLRFRV
jgi:hypothetical protein